MFLEVALYQIPVYFRWSGPTATVDNVLKKISMIFQESILSTLSFQSDPLSQGPELSIRVYSPPKYLETIDNSNPLSISLSQTVSNSSQTLVVWQESIAEMGSSSTGFSQMHDSYSPTTSLTRIHTTHAHVVVIPINLIPKLVLSVIDAKNQERPIPLMTPQHLFNGEKYTITFTSSADLKITASLDQISSTLPVEISGLTDAEEIVLQSFRSMYNHYIDEIMMGPMVGISLPILLLDIDKKLDQRIILTIGIKDHTYHNIIKKFDKNNLEKLAKAIQRGPANPELIERYCPHIFKEIYKEMCLLLIKHTLSRDIYEAKSKAILQAVNQLATQFEKNIYS